MIRHIIASVGTINVSGYKDGYLSKKTILAAYAMHLTKCKIENKTAGLVIHIPCKIVAPA